MIMPELTKDADKMICIIYKMYLEKIKSGMSKVASNAFEEDFYKSDKMLSKWHDDDVNMTFLELGQKKYLKIHITGDFEITNQAIIYMENRFKNGLLDLVDFVTKFI
uniref:hypothetical protein n=1 Tax=uncultured Ruminococcus sp. TaxID=165186 RepID=UPI0025D021C4|nr:hypothetical protein [uncultured Ruminococcus sp.]